MTARDLVYASLRLIGAVAPGETPEAHEATDGLSAINRMISGWSNEGLLVFKVTEETPLTLTPGDGTITLGSSGDITTRPQEIVAAIIRDGTTDYPPMRLLTAEEYAAIPDKSASSEIPAALYDDGGYPQRSVKLYPIPSAAKSLALFTKRPLTEFSTLDTEISLPPGYEEALVYNGAVRLAPEFGRAVSPEVADIAIQSLANIKRANHKQSFLECDPAVLKRNGRYNIHTGGQS